MRRPGSTRHRRLGLPSRVESGIYTTWWRYTGRFGDEQRLTCGYGLRRGDEPGVAMQSAASPPASGLHFGDAPLR
ncbi:hypothetical protein BRADI_4g30273v3 [Brachypodium distachyon]|uniref:Uncharacterized protein n=1 Tax=Brachypodium distachyon TaxID=15368 RepID=A0A2K2CRA0_BRADI|nr:hypothetical protein BRADI_4g30273v3 [Brachypodium distachyon]